MTAEITVTYRPNRWWITTGPIPAGGKKVLGPFESQNLAIMVRSFVEGSAGEGRTYWVDDDGPDLPQIARVDIEDGAASREDLGRLVRGRGSSRTANPRGSPRGKTSTAASGR